MQANGNKWARGPKKKDFSLYYRHPMPENLPKNVITGNISYYSNATLFWLNGVNEIEFAASGIHEGNASEFLYHVVANDSTEIVEWSSPKSFKKAGNIAYAYLGRFDTRNRILKLEIYRKQCYHDRSVNILNNLVLRPAVVKKLELNYNDKYLFRPHQQVLIPDNKQHRYFEKDWSTDRIGFNWSDSINHLAVSMKNTVQNDMYSIYLVREINGTKDTSFISNNWEISYHTPDPFHGSIHPILTNQEGTRFS
jgi:two-component system, LytTR family, sensor kinase